MIENPRFDEIALSVQNLSKTYPIPFPRLRKIFRRKSKAPVEALREVSFACGRGEIFGLIGPNGAGKTTLIKIIATLIQPTTGQVAVHGFDTVREEEQVRRRVGLAGAEERSFYWRLTPAQNLMFFARLYGLSGRAARQRINELAELFETKDLKRQRFAELSTGNKQRLAIARALLAGPSILLLDEPTRSLDPIAAARVRQTIKSLTQDSANRRTVFLTSHNLTEVEELCDRVAIISKGRIRVIDTPKNLRTSHTESEGVSIHFTTDWPNAVEEALREAFTDHFLTLGRSSHEHQWNVRFSHLLTDDVLDRVLRVMQRSGAVIRTVETEQASLLEVLETYQSEDKEAQS